MIGGAPSHRQLVRPSSSIHIHSNPKFSSDNIPSVVPPCISSCHFKAVHERHQIFSLDWRFFLVENLAHIFDWRLIQRHHTCFWLVDISNDTNHFFWTVLYRRTVPYNSIQRVDKRLPLNTTITLRPPRWLGHVNHQRTRRMRCVFEAFHSDRPDVAL
jgi:hypothetical protein